MPLSLLAFVFLSLFSKTATAQSTTVVSELQILLNFKEALVNISRKDGFFDSWVPSSPNSPCKFSGVTCDSNGNVTGIDISNRGISGNRMQFQSICQLPHLSKFLAGSNSLSGNATADIRGCTNLVELDLGSNSFTGEIPDLSPLTKLQVLNLSGNGFTGKFPAYFLGNLTDLVALFLGDNLFDPSPFPTVVTGLTRLNWLYLSNCSITGSIPPEIGNLKNLIDLELADNSITGGIPSEITKLTNLWQLELYDNSLTGTIPSGFRNLKNLVYFDASSNRLEGNLSEIGFLTNLVSLQLFENSFSGDIPVELGEFKNLVNLSLYSNQLTGELPQKLGSWAEFNFIDVSTNFISGRIPPDMCKRGTMQKLLMLENNLTGEIPSTYGNCTSLLRFRVSQNSLSGVVPEGIWSLPNVNIIDLATNNFSGGIGVGIGKAKSLTQLLVSDNQFSGHLREEISGANGLVTLDLRSNHLSGDIPTTIGDLKRLNFLLLSENEFSGEIPESLGSCSHLNELNLADNSLSGVIPSIVGNLQLLNSLNLSGNDLTGEIPGSLSSLKLSILDLSNNHFTGEVPPDLTINAFGQSFVGNPDLCGNKVDFLRPCSSKSRSPSTMFHTILSCLLAVVAVALGTVAGFHFIKRRRISSNRDLLCSNNGTSHRKSFISKDSSSWDLKSFRILTFEEKEILNGITQENLIGKGGSGEVYRVVLNGGKTVAVKHIWNYPDRMDPSNLPGCTKESKVAMLTRRGSAVSREFEAEVGTLSSIRHVNVVELYCSITREDSSLLVYEYLPNGSLWDILHGGGGGRKVIDWDARYEVAIGAARGLEYLHQGCSRPILHRDVKSSNILLDEFLKPRIADFGLAKILHVQEESTTRVIAGTLGYLAPEYAYTCKVNEKSDVYSFGVVLMELVTGKRPIEPEFGESKDIVHWVCSKMGNREHAMSVLDSRIPEEMEEEAVKVLRVGVLCTVRLPALRPSMRTVVKMLEDAGGGRSEVAFLDDCEKI